MISSSLHPDPVQAVCQPRRRWGFGLTPRAIGLLIVGFLWLIPGFWNARFAYAMLAWDGLILLAAVLDGMRLPRAAQITAGRSWANAPALDSETEIELTIENRSRVIIECRLRRRSARGTDHSTRHAPAHRVSARRGFHSLQN